MISLKDKINDVELNIARCQKLLQSLKWKSEVDESYIRTIQRLHDHYTRDHEILIKALTIIDMKRRKKFWRDNILIQYNFTCSRCNSTHDLTVHHLIPRSQCSVDMKWADYNGVVLCIHCHRLWHDTYDANDNLRLFLRWLDNDPLV